MRFPLWKSDYGWPCTECESIRFVRTSLLARPSNVCAIVFFMQQRRTEISGDARFCHFCREPVSSGVECLGRVQEFGLIDFSLARPRLSGFRANCACLRSRYQSHAVQRVSSKHRVYNLFRRCRIISVTSLTLTDHLGSNLAIFRNSGIHNRYLVSDTRLIV
jgi:hypothetical protein